MRLATDLSSLLWTTLRVGKDPEGSTVEHLGKEIHVNTAAYAYEKTVNSILTALQRHNLQPMDLILVEEGLSTKRRRLMIDAGYKSARKPKHPDEYAQFQLLRDQIVDLFQGLGAIRCVQDGAEGDDVLGWLAENMEEALVIHTFDNDLMVLQGTNKYGADIIVRVGNEEGINKYGEFSHRLITTYKALVGDTSDSIKGCPGFGEKSFIELFKKYGESGIADLQQLLESGTLVILNSLDSCPLIHKILSNEAQVLKSYKVAKIHPEWVDTVQDSLQWFGGMVKSTCTDERLKRYRQQKRLVTNDNLLAAYNFLGSKLAETREPSFDIETSACEESDAWMEAQGKPDGVDVLGHRLTGFSLTFGANMQYTYYVSVDHKDTDNISLTDARMMLELVFNSGKQTTIQNTSFEAAVLATTEENGKTWQELWADNGYRGFIPNWLDTVFEASYVNENIGLGLKDRSLHHLGYQQQTFLETVCRTGPPAKLPEGGRLIKVEYLDSVDLQGNPIKVEVHTKQYKMNELTAAEVFDYGADDTICTGALHNLYKLIMQLEHSWQTYLKVEIAASYQHADNFLKGKSFSLETMRELQALDDTTYEAAWATVRGWLTEQKWAGTVPPVYGQDITAKQIKEAYSIFLGVVEEDEGEDEEAEEGAAKDEVKDPILSSRVRTPSKFPALLRDAEVDELFVQGVEQCMASEAGAANFTKFIQSKFTGEPLFKISPKQMHKVLYELMDLPIRVRNKPTANMKAKGIREGAPMTNALAVKYALMECSEEQKKVLGGLQLMQMVKTRRGLYYSTYPYFIHWKTGRIHSYHRQCATNTRRASSAMPNEQQMPKHVKVEGQPSRFRECVIPHKKGAVVVSLDFSQQELRVIADYSRDANMVACYVGDNKKDMHILTALGIIKRKFPELNWAHDELLAAYGDKTHAQHKFAKKYRKDGKDTNFTTEFGAAAPKLAQTLLVSEEEAQTYIDAKEEAFPEVRVWKDAVIADSKATGKSYTKLGAVRHLAELLNSEDGFIRSKAERQSVNFKVQSSSAEMTKLAEGRVWEEGLTFKFDSACYGPVHDELVFSVMEADLLEFLQAAHACMVAPYADMWIPIESSISFGPNFGVQFEIGTEPTQAAIDDGMKQWRKWELEQAEEAAKAAA